MKTDVYVINANNTSHEMNFHTIRCDFIKEIVLVKNAKTKHIVNID